MIPIDNNRKFVKVLRINPDNPFEYDYTFPYTPIMLKKDYPNVSFGYNLFNNKKELSYYNIYEVDEPDTSHVELYSEIESIEIIRTKIKLISNDDIMKWAFDYNIVVKEMNDMIEEWTTKIKSDNQYLIDEELLNYKQIVQYGYPMPDRDYCINLEEEDINKFTQLVVMMNSLLQGGIVNSSYEMEIKSNDSKGTLYSEQIQYLMMALTYYGIYCQTIWKNHKSNLMKINDKTQILIDDKTEEINILYSDYEQFLIDNNQRR